MMFKFDLEVTDFSSEDRIGLTLIQVWYLTPLTQTWMALVPGQFSSSDEVDLRQSAATRQED